ncbi:hypothetical protein CCR80_01805 [Rhodothalassium salexigens]|nr:hypothetical protein [Rhodothalassium salexigens]
MSAPSPDPRSPGSARRPWLARACWWRWKALPWRRDLLTRTAGTLALLGVSAVGAVAGGASAVDTPSTAAQEPVPSPRAAGVTRFNPPTLFDSRDFSHVAVVTGRPGRAYVAGLGPHDADGRISAGHRLQKQVQAVLANARRALDAVGAGPEDVVRLHIYVADYHPMHGLIVSPKVRAFFDGRMPVSSFVPVAGLAWPGARIQIDMEVALPPEPPAGPDGRGP